MKVLVADDDSVIRMLTGRQLEAWGHEVCCAADGAEALHAVARDPSVEVLMLDWMMPEMDGLEVCRRARLLDRPHYLFIILISSRSAREDFLEGMSAGADDFMTKPLDVDELRVRMHSAERVIHLQTETQVQAAIAEELREIDRMKSAFINLTSHELRSPLSLMFLNLESLAAHPAMQDEEARNTVRGVSDAAQRLWRIVEETLKASRAGRFVKMPVLESADMGQLAREVVNAVTPFATLRAQHLRVETAPDLPPVRVDRDKIADALSNLLMNAIKFTPDGLCIEVRVSRDGANGVQVAVKDPGMGICEADKPHVFEPLFSTLDITHHSSGDYKFGKRGIGLGLTIARDFVEMHGGTLGFESEEGRGSCFHFTIPVAR